MDYTKTQRIVLLIDLNPLLHRQSPKYLATLLAASKTLISFPPLSNSLFSFKLFLSSLSPLLSSSALLKTPNPIASFNPDSLNFDRPGQTLISLSETLDSVSAGFGLGKGECASRGVFIASSVYQIVHDYEWEGRVEDPVLLGTDCGDGLGGFDPRDFVRSNLVVLFSPVCRSLEGFCDYWRVDEGVGNVLLSDSDAFCVKFSEVFGHVRDAFDRRGIHFSWVDVGYEIGQDSIGVDVNESSRLLKVFRSGIRRFDWGFCSSESIVLGSALVPFGLIYPVIGVSPLLYDSKEDSAGKVFGKLNLEILDVSGKPLGLGCCDLQLHEMRASDKCKLIDGPHDSELMKLLDNDSSAHSKAFWGQFGDGVAKIDVVYVGRYDGNMKCEDCVSTSVLVYELSEENKKRSEGLGDQFFADKVLQMLSTEDGNKFVKKSLPTWQILLSYLQRRSYSALVNLSNANGSRCMGIFKPLTIWSAVLSVTMGKDEIPAEEHDLGRPTLLKFGFNPELDSSNRMQSSGKRKRSKKHAHIYKDLSWSSFCNASYEYTEMELEEAYFSKECDNSKKLKFIRCWMKQVEKNGCFRVCEGDQTTLCKGEPETVLDRLSHAREESEQPLTPSFSAGQTDLSEPVRIEMATCAAPPEAPEDFLGTLSERIEDGIQSGLDLVALADRLVCSSILCLNKKLEVDIDHGSQTSIEKLEVSNSAAAIVAELIKILLKDPKDLAGKHRDGDQSSNLHDEQPTKFSSEEKVRQYELQILFRMELLQSEVANDIKPSMKQKFVKHICSYFEMVQYNVEGGVLGNFNLNDYVGKIINRYSQNLGDMIHRIYEQLDLLLFEDEDESPNPLLNSEDSSQSWGDKPVRRDERLSISQSTDDSLSQHLPDNDVNERGSSKEDYAHRLAEAREKRQKACRLSSFTRGMADLQRVWAPKQPKLSRTKCDSHHMRSRRKSGRLESYDSVSETPMAENRRSSCPGSSTGDQERQELGGIPCSSVYKSLFQD